MMYDLRHLYIYMIILSYTVVIGYSVVTTVFDPHADNGIILVHFLLSSPVGERQTANAKAKAKRMSYCSDVY